ncbi:MAG: hypothetical protein ACYCZY_09815 [Lacisediminihabitans sp.]
MRRPRITHSARKHRIGAAHIYAALDNAGEPTEIDPDALLYVGIDDRGIESEMIVVDDDKREGQAVIHVMPTSFRSRRRTP